MSAHVLFASGGKFYLLLPNTEKVRTAIYGKGGIKEQTEKELWEEHKGKISVNISNSAFAYRNKKQGDKWKLYTSNPDEVIKTVANLAKKRNMTFASINICKAELEDIFITLTEDKEYAD